MKSKEFSERLVLVGFIGMFLTILIMKIFVS